MATGFTMSYNHALQDAQLSLPAKGLYLIMQSFVGMPDFALTKAALYRVCGDSHYTFEKAWHELKTSGYLHHFYSIGPNGGFCHAYDLCQAPEAVHAFAYTSSLERPNGDLRLQPSDRAVRGFTRLPNAVLRSRELPLGVKGLFGLVARLLDIPGFQLRPAGVLHYCREKARRFGTLWRKLKLAGLLKQHRYPSGEDNVFTYEYDLLAEPELQTPYLTNYHADGSISSSASIQDYLTLLQARAQARLPGRRKRKAQKRVRAIQASRTRKYQPSETQLAAIQTQMEYDDLVTHYPKAHVDLVRTALAELRHAPAVTVQQQPLSPDERTSLWEKVSRTTLSAFLDAPSWADRLRVAQYPAAYLRSVLVGFLRRQPTQAAADAPLDAWELEWLADFHHRKKKNS